MSFFALISLTSAVVAAYLGMVVYVRNRYLIANRLFMWLCLACSYRAFTEFMYRQSESLDRAFVWVRLICVWPFAFSLLVHFAMAYTEHPCVERKCTAWFLYIPAAIISLISFVITFPEPASWGYVYKYPGGWLSGICILWGAGMALFAAFLIGKKQYQLASSKKKRQMFAIFVGTLLMLPQGLVTEVFGRFAGIILPEMSTVSFILFAGCVAYAMKRYQLFELTPATAAQNIVATMAEPLVLLRTDTTIQMVNPAMERLSGYAAHALVNKPLRLLFQDAEFDKLSTSLVLPGDIDEQEWQLVTAGGTSVCVGVNASRVRDDQGTVVGVVLTMRDLTERKRLAEERLQLERQFLQTEKLASIGQLAGGVAHEINNPLSVILGFAQVCERDVQKDSETAKHIKLIEQEAQRVRDLVQRLLVYSRVTGEPALEEDIADVIRESLQLAQAGGGPRTGLVTINVQHAPDVGRIRINRNQIQQVFINLCSNAFDAMPDGGVLTVTTAREELPGGPHFLAISWADTGMGIPSDHVRRIFDPFFTTKSPGKGTGLGLSVSHEIIKQHGGSITVESTVGSGSTFTVFLPYSLPTD